MPDTQRLLLTPHQLEETDVKGTRGQVGAWKGGSLPSWIWRGVLEMTVLSCVGKDVRYFFSQTKKEGRSRQ